MADNRRFSIAFTIFLDFWTIYLRDTKNKVLLFCFVQALFVVFVCLSVIVYMPDLVMEEPMSHDQLLYQQEIQQYEKEQEKHQKTQQHRENLWRGETLNIVGGLTCTLFHFDLMPGLVETSPKELINGEGEYSYFSKQGAYLPDNIPVWFDNQQTFCSGRLTVYGPGKYVVNLQGVTIYPKFGHGKVGGEHIEDVIMQKEEDEKITLEEGYFVINANEQLPPSFTLTSYLQNFLNGLLVMKETDLSGLKASNERRDMVAVVITRREYANFYHTTMDWFDVFLIMVLFKIDPYHLEIIWLDAHPKSSLDNAWETIYGVPIRSGSLKDPVKYGQMIWSGFGHKSHINQHKLEYLPFANEYRHFVLSRFEVEDKHKINCRELRITIIWRRHYLAHPRNPSGYTTRRISNEEEVWNAVREADTMAVVNGVQLEKLSMVDQLELIAKTDILIGMHGAGLSHILYLPDSSGVIELFPNYMSVANAHFRAMSKWRNLKHLVWVNSDKTLETKDHSTTIPKPVIQDLVRTLKRNICEEQKQNK